MSNELTKSTIQSFTKREPAGTSLAERIRAAVHQTQPQGNQSNQSMPQDVALLLDVSGSMNEYIGANVRKIHELAKLASSFTDIRRFTFHSSVDELKPDEDIGGPHGGTNMALAFQTLQALHVRHVVMITDGEPDDEAKALKAARGLKVDVFYVGQDPAPQFLRDLAGQTGGQYGSASLQARPALQAAIRALLPAPGQAGKRVIEL